MVPPLAVTVEEYELPAVPPERGEVVTTVSAAGGASMMASERFAV